MTELIFATNNANKLREINTALPANVEVKGLKDAGIYIDIPEPHDSLQANAKEKADVIFELTGKACFSEDTGLFVDALNGEPGVRSARYAGEPANDANNISLLLQKLTDIEDRDARFKTVICLRTRNDERYFEGVCKGRIIHKTHGEQGFGYDPVFIPQDSEKTFAEMGLDEKSKFSHRKKAFSKLIEYINACQESK